MADSLAVSKDQAVAKLEPVSVWTPEREQLMAECRPKASIGSIRRIDGAFTGYG